VTFALLENRGSNPRMTNTKQKYAMMEDNQNGPEWSIG